MKKNLYLFIISLFLIVYVHTEIRAQCPAVPTCNKTAVAGTNYTLTASDVLCISTNYNSGNLTINGGTVIIQSGGTLGVTPSISTGTVHIATGGTLNSDVAASSSAVINNCGKISGTRSINPNVALNNYGNNDGVLLSLKQDNGFTLNNYGKNLSVSIDGNPNGTFNITNAAGATITSLATTHPSSGLKSGSVLTNLGAINLTSDILWEGTINNGNVSGSQQGSITSAAGTQIEFRGPWTINNNPSSTLQFDKIYLNNLSAPGQGALLQDQSVLSVNTIVGNNIVEPIKGIGGCSYFKSYNVFSSTSNQNLFKQVAPGAISYCGPVPVNSAAQTFGIVSVVSNGGNPALYRVTVNSSNNSGSINNTLISIRFVSGNQSNGYWRAKLISTSSGTATYDLISPNGAVYAFDNAATSGTGTFYWTASTFGDAYYAGYDCNNPALTTKIVTAGPSQTVCANNPTVTLAGDFTAAVSGIIWSGGAGTFVPNNTTKNATYTPTAAEIAAGSVTLTITTTGSTPCNQQSDKVTVAYTAAPTVNAGPAVAGCVNSPAIALTGTATNQTGVTWSGGTGTFTPPGSLSTTYNPSAAEKTGAPKTITLTLTANKAGCNSVTSNVNVTINPSPIVNAGRDTSICKNDSFNLAGIVSNATGGKWSGGTGKFTPDENSLTANYKPSAAELTGSSVTLTLTSTGNGSCLAETDQMKISFTPAPTIIITGPAAVCENNPTINLSSVVTGATGQSWIGSGGSFTPNITTSPIVYTPSNAELSFGFTGIVVKTTGGKCPPVTDTIIVTFGPAPKVDGGPPTSICENNPTGSLTGSVTGVSSVIWTSPTGGLFSAPTNPVTDYTATAADITNGSVLLTVTATKPTCNAVTDQVLITITPQPTVSAGPARSVCANNATATFNGSFTSSTGVLWTTAGDGTFGSPTAATTTYTAGPNDITAGTVNVTITTTGNGNCLAVSASTKMTITPRPTVTPGTYSVCANNAAVQLNGSVTIATGVTWVGGAGTFTPSRNVLNPTYTPTTAETAAGSLSITLQSTGNGNCNAVTGNATITFTPAPTITPTTPANVCADAPTANITTTKTIASGVLWSGGAGTIPAPTSLSTSYTPTTTEINSGSVTLTVTTTGNGLCSPVSATMTVKIAPAPTVHAGSNQVVCGTVATVSNLTGAVTGATGGTWTKVSGTGTFGNANAISTTYTPSNQDILNGSVTLKLTTTGNGLCQPVSNTMTITYTPVPSINAGVDQIVCSTELPVKLSASGSPANWNTSGGTYGNTASLITTYTPSAGEIAAGTVTLSISTIASGACPIKTSHITITIPAGPIVNPGTSNQTMCGSFASYQLNGAVTNATGGIWSTTGTGSFLPNANTLNATYTPSAVDRTKGSVLLTLTSTGNGLCQQVSKTITLTITPAIVVTAGPDQTLCADAGGITLNGAVTTATGGIWSITSGSGSIASSTSLITTYTPTAADIAAGTVSFLLTSTGNGGCPAVTSTVIHTLTPAPTLNQGANQSICGDSAYVQLNATFTTATGIKWASNGTGTFAPNNVTANARYIPSAADVASGTVILTATTTGNGTCNPVVKNVTVTITPVVSLTIPSTQSVCQNNSTVTLTASTTATAVSWTTSGTGTFASSTSPATTYTPSAADIAAGIVTLTNKTTGITACKTQSGIVQVLIAPAPVVDAGLPQTVCSTTSSISLNGSVLHAGGGTWTSNGSGTFANANAATTTYAPSKTDTTAGSVIFTLTSTGNGTCIPVSKNVTVTFKKIAEVYAGPDQTICGDSAYVQLAGTIINAGGGIWTKSGTGAFFPSTIDLNAVYTPTPADKTNGSVTITLTSASNGECPAVSDNMIITITPAPIVTVSSDKTVCANNAVTTVTGTATVSSAIKWTTSGTGTFAPNNTSLTAIYTPSAIDKAAGSVVLSMLTTANGLCKPAQRYLTLTITPIPVLNAGFDKTICGDSVEVKLNQAAVTTATGVQWSTNGTGVFGPNNTTLQPTYYPTAADKTAGKVKLAVITTGNGTCLAVKDTLELTITPVPTVNAGSDISVCADTNSVKLSGSFTVAGGVTWTSTGAGTFTPSASVANASYIPSDDQTVTLTLTTTNNGSCKAVTDDLLVLVAPKPVVNAGTDRTVCADVNQLPLAGTVTHSTGGLWTTSGSGSFSPGSSTLNPSYSPSPSDLTVGNVILTLVSTGNGLCKPVSDNVSLMFNPVATISAGNDLQTCNSVSTVDINGSFTNVSNVNWQIVSGNGSLTAPSNISTSYIVAPADIAAGSVTLRVTGTALSGCSNVSDVVVITFVAIPPIDAGNDKTVCDTDVPIIPLEGSGSTAEWTSLSTGVKGTFSPNAFTLNASYTPSADEIASGTVTLELKTLNDGGCGIATDQVTFTILNGPIVNAGTAPQICTNSSLVHLTGTTNGISSTGVAWSTSGSGTFTGGNSTAPTYIPSASDKIGGKVILTISSTGNTFCKVVSDTLHLLIAPAPSVTTGTDQIVCGDASTVNISSTFSNATGVQWTNVTANGTYGNSTSANTTYVVATPADTTAGSVTIQVATTGQLAGCPAATNQMTITFTKKPTVRAGLPITVCTDTTSIPLSGAVSVATGGIWSSPSGGTFTPSANQLNAKYIPSAADKASGSVNLTLTSTGNGTCNAYTGNVAITLNQQPAIAGSVPNDSICTGNTVSATATVTNTTSMIWKTTGTGTFSTTTGSNTVYTPSVTDESNGGVIIYVSTVGSNPCKEIEKYFAITILKSPGALVNAGFDQIACADGGFFPLNGTIDGVSGTGIWTSSGSGYFEPADTDLNPLYIASQDDIDAGELTITLSTTNNSICPPYSDNMILTLTPSPVVSANASAGAFPPLCSDTAYIQLSPSITNASGGEWSTTGTGIFSPSITDLNAVYVPSADDRTKGFIGITLTTTGNGTCNAYFDFMTIHLTPKPTINAGADKIICADEGIDLNATVTVATGVDWLATGTGFFTSATNTLSTQYIMSDIDTTNRVFNIFAKTVNQGLCKPAYDTIKITVQPVPVVRASSDQIICADANTIQVRAAVNNASGTLWTTNGSGSFSPNASVNPVTYNVSQADAFKGTLELYATSAHSGICSSRTDTVKVSISPVPIVSTGAPIICETALGAKLTGAITSAATGTATWSSSGTGVFAINNSVLNASYFPTAADIAAGQVILTLTASNYGTCNAVTNNAILLIEPIPLANAGPDQYSCVGSNVTVLATNTQNGVSYSWTDNTNVIVQPANSTSHTFTVSANTQRILLATDQKGCTSRDTVNITTFDLPLFNLPPTACYSENLLIKSNPSPEPIVPGTYQWFDNGNIMTNENKPFLIVPDTGTYKIEFSFANCASNNQVVVQPVPTITAADIVACGNATLTATVNSNASIDWSVAGTSKGSGSPLTIQSTANDTIQYDIRATNPATGCSNTDSVYVIGLPIPEMVELDSTSCIGLTVRLTARPNNIPQLDQFLDVKFDWRKDGGSVFSVDSTVIINTAGTFNGTISVGQCKDTSTNTISFSEYPTSTLPDNYTYCPDTDKVILDPGTLPNTTYVWNNGFIGSKNTVSPKDDSTYVVTVTNQFFCSITDKTIVYSICAPVIDVPTAFTPDVAGSGDQTFRGFGKYETNYKMMVFNRWGEVIFISNDKLVGWDGNYLGAEAPSGVYPWIVTYEGRAQYKGPYKKTGQVTLIR